MSSPLPTLQFLVAFQNGPVDDPALITTVATPAGTLGAANVWTDISRFVKATPMLTRGRMHELYQFEAGELELTLDNTDGRFSPWNTSGPYTGFVTVRKLVQVRATWAGVGYTLWTGHVDLWSVQWLGEFTTEATLHAADAFRFLNGSKYTTDYARDILRDSPAGFWPCGDNPLASSLYPLNAYPLVDVSGNGADLILTYINVPDYTFNVADPFGGTNAISTNGGFATGLLSFHSGVAVPASNTAYTVEMWIKTSTVPTHEVFLHEVGQTTRVTMVLTNSGTISWDGIVFGTTVVTDGQWHHVAVAHDPATTSEVWVDGILDASSGPHPGSWDTLQSLFFDYEPSVPTDVYVGSFSGLAVFTSKLSGLEISLHALGGKPPQESTDTRIKRVLRTVSWPSGAEAIDVGSSTDQHQSQALTSTASLQHMQYVECT
jgi:hypothetical protein